MKWREQWYLNLSISLLIDKRKKKKVLALHAAISLKDLSSHNVTQPLELEDNKHKFLQRFAFFVSEDAYWSPIMQQIVYKITILPSSNDFNYTVPSSFLRNNYTVPILYSFTFIAIKKHTFLPRNKID